jgi:hypothetical protein
MSSFREGRKSSKTAKLVIAFQHRSWSPLFGSGIDPDLVFRIGHTDLV